MQENTTYFDDTRYDNLTSLVAKGEPSPDKLSAKLAKLSALARVKNNINKIKSELSKNVVETPVEVQSEMTVEAPKVTPEVQSPEEAPKTEEPEINYPTKEVLEAKTEGIAFYNGLNNSSSESLGRKLRVAPQVTNSMKYALNTLGVEYIKDNVETELATPIENSTDMELPGMETDVTPNVSVEETPTFDFSALPGVGDIETNNFNEPVALPQDEPEVEQPTYEEHMTTEEQDSRLNDYLNRDTSFDTTNNINTDLEEIRKLKKEIEDARNSLKQVEVNVEELQQKDSSMSEQLAGLKERLLAEKEEVNREFLARTTEWNNLTQAVKAKEALMNGEDFFQNGKTV